MERQSDKRQKLIDAYLLGTLDASSQEQLDNELKTDPGFQSELDAATEAFDAIDVFGDQQAKAQLERLEQKLRNNAADTAAPVSGSEEGTTAKVIAIGARRRWLAVAAAVLVLFTAGWFLLRPTSVDGPALYAANFEPFRNIATTVVRDAQPDALTAEERAYLAYDNKNWETADALLAALPNTPVHDFYRAQAALASQDYDKAESLLEPLVSQNDFPLQQQAAWYLALANLGADDTTRAQQLLESIVNTEGHPYTSQAAALLKNF